MSRELHHRKKDNKYAIYSTVVDDYITPFASKEKIKQWWLNDMIENDTKKVEMYMQQIDEEV